MYANYLKRFFDFLIALIALLVLSPILIVTAILVRIKLGSPFIFKQERPGYQEKIFTLYKFRTMTNGTDAKGNLLPDEQRLTHFGKFLRKTSIDELPEMFNILIGDMAFIGPRPLLVEYLKLYTPEQHKRHNVRPGMACLSAIKGRNSLAWVERLELDVWYAEHVSFVLDASIFLQTIKIVLMRKGSPDAVDSSRGTLEDANKKLKNDKLFVKEALQVEDK